VTDRLYYHDSSLIEFDARVVRRVTTPDRRPGVILDRTAFYPTSGGQPFDTGALGGVRVVEVIDQDDGDLLHVLDAPLADDDVRGVVDWARRLEHMQQHTGQHVLSAAFDRVVGARTESFHLGAEAATIDLGRDVSADEAVAAEDEANRVVWADRPVIIRFADATEAARLPLRKESVREGTLRLVEVADFDLSACGGTHVERTGTIGMIAISGIERFKGGSRVEFVCGGRALRSHRRLRDIVAGSVKVLSVAPHEIPDSIGRVQNQSNELRRQIKDLQTRLAGHEADTLAATAATSASHRVVVAMLEGWDAPALKQIATAIVSRPGHVAILIGAPSPSPIVVSRAADTAFDSGAALKQMVARFGGKGGGRPELAQGGGLTGVADEMLAFARTLVGLG
jgi:alanyl-tRNA synthetase